LFGLNIQTKDDEKEFFHKIKRFRTDMIKDITVSGIGGFGENGMIDMFNWGEWFLKNRIDPTFNTPYSEFIKNDAFLYPNHRATTTPMLDYMGSYGILPKELLRYYENIKGGITGVYRNEYAYSKEEEDESSSTKRTTQKSEDVELTKNQRRYLQFLSVFDVAALFGARDADFMRTLETTKTEMIRSAKNKQTPKNSPSW